MTAAVELVRQSECDKYPPWTGRDVALLRAHAHLGAEALAVLLGRTPRAVRAQACRLRISLRRSGERRGLILGQRRGESWGTRTDTARIRAAVLAGSVDAVAVEALLARLVAGEVQVLCPSCSRRYVDHRSGVCRPCHLRALADAHRDAEALADAQRDLWQARQGKSRSARREDSGG